MPKSEAPATPQGNPNHSLPPIERARDVKIQLETHTKPNPESFVPPPPQAEANAAMRSQESQRAAEMDFRKSLQGNREDRARIQHEQLNNVLAAQRGPAPRPTNGTPGAITDAEKAAIRERLAKNKSGLETEEIKVDAKISQAANLLVNHMRSLSAQWNAQIEALKLERGLRDDQVALSLMAATLENGQHLLMPLDHPYFMNGFKAGGSNFECVICGKVQPRRIAGQNPFCAPPWHDGVVKHCAEKFRALSQEEQQELLSLA